MIDACRRPLALLLLGAPLFACGPATNLLPDGGHERLVCNTEPAFISVKVLDATGAAAQGATVTGTNVGSGKVATGTTNSNGVSTAIGEDLGQGTVRVQATLNGKVSSAREASFVCGECGCVGEPNTLTLTLSP